MNELIYLLVCTDVVVLVMDTEYSERRKFFSFEFKFRGICWLFICNGVCSKMGNNMCVWEWTSVGVGVLVPVSIGRDEYGDTVWVIFCRKAGPMNGLL